MIFAHQKLRQRRAKETVFKIRGRLLTSQDIEHYWKRKRLDPPALPSCADTPGGLEYRTPSPLNSREPLDLTTLDQDVISDGHFLNDMDVDFDMFDVDQDLVLVLQSPGLRMLTSPKPFRHGQPLGNSLNHDTSSHETISSGMDLDFHTLFEINQELFPIPQSPGLRMVSSPEPFRSREQAFHYSNTYLRLFVERGASQASSRVLLKEDLLIKEFRHKASNATSAVRWRRSRINIEAAKWDMFQLIPSLTTQFNLSLLSALLEVITHCIYEAQNFGYKELETLIWQILHKVEMIFHKQAHPLLLILRVLVHQPWQDACALSERILMASKDTLAREIGQNHSTRRQVLIALRNILCRNGNWTKAHEVTTELYQISLRQHETEMTDDSLFFLLESQNMLVACCFGTSDLMEAEVLVKNGHERCSKLSAPRGRDIIRSIFLEQQGKLYARRGQVGEAIRALSEALTITLRVSGAADAYVPWIVDTIQKLEDMHQSGYEGIPLALSRSTLV